MASALEALASGLRGAGGILSPEVQKMDEAQRRQDDQQSEQRRNMLAQLTIRGAEAGSIDPVKATETLKGLGINAPEGSIGPTPEALARKQAYDNEVGFRKEVSGLGAGASSLQVAQAAQKWGKPELAVQMYQKEEDRIARAQAREDALNARLAQQQQISADKAADREARASAAAVADETKRLLIASQTETARMRNDLMQAKADQIKDDKIRVDARKLSQDLNKAGLVTTDAALGKVEQALKDTPALAQAIATPNSLTPDWMLPKAIANGKQDFQSLFNITLKDRSGSAVTNTELDRLKREFGAGVFTTPAQVKHAVERMREIVSKHYAGIAAGYGKEALTAYNNNLREMGGSVVLDDPGSKVVDFNNL